MKVGLGHDFSTVRHHADPMAVATARAVQARAPTISSHSVLPGEPLESVTGSRLLAYELAHVVHQRDTSSDVMSATVPQRADTPSEHDARAVAHGADPAILRSVGRRPTLQREPLDPSDEGPVTSPGPEPGAAQLVSRTLGSPGAPLHPRVRAAMELRLGHDFSAVRIHSDPVAAASARAVQARAYTIGSHIVLPGQPPESVTGSRLLAHELAHVVQQRDTSPDMAAATGPQRADTPSEHDARAVARGADRTVLRSVGHAPVLQREPLDPSHEGPLTSAMDQNRPGAVGAEAEEWVERFQVQLAQRLGELLLATPFALAEFGASWTASGHDQFVAKLGQDLLRPSVLSWNLGRAIGTDALTRAVNAGRDADPSGPPIVWLGAAAKITWQPGVAPEILSRLALRINEAIGRVIMRVAAYEMRRANEASSGTPQPQAPTRGAPKPQPLAVSAFSNPVDPYVFGALADNVSFDWKRLLSLLASAGTYDTQRRLRRVTFAFQASYGASLWLRVIEPQDATLFEVAYELFGDLTSANLLVDAHPLYGFRERDVGSRSATFGFLPLPGFRPEHRAAHEAALKTGPLPLVTTEPLSPMQQVLMGRLGNEVSLRAAPAVSGAGTTPAAIVQRLTLINDRFAQIVAIAPALAHRPADPSSVLVVGKPGFAEEPFRSPGEVEWDARLRIAADRLRKRLLRLAGAADERELLLWDAQSAGQLQILNSAFAGLNIAAALATDYREQPRIHEAIQDVASRYVAAAEISDAYGPAYEQLAAAERQSRLFPVTAMELVLADLRASIDAARVSKIENAGPNESRYALSVLDRTELEVRERLARIRPLLLSAPGEAKEELRNIGKLLQDLQAGVGLVGNLDAIDAVVQALMSSMSWSGAFRSLFGHYGNEKIQDAFIGALKLRDEWWDIYNIWLVDKTAARRLLREKAEGKQWRTWFSDMRVLIHDQAQADAWTKFGFMVGIALITAGIGTYVEAAAGAAWGSTAGFFAATGAEAISFTSMSYLILEKDPSVSGFFEQVALNFLTFGALRLVSLGYRGLLGATKAATPVGKLGEIGTQFVALNGFALAQANYVKQRDTGTSLTQEEILAISLQNLGFVGAMTLGTFLLKSPLINLSLRGELTGANYRVRRAAAALESTVTKATVLEAKGGPATVRIRAALVDAEDAYIAAERNLLLALGRSVRRADLLPPSKGEELLGELGIAKPLAQAVRSGEATQQVKAYLDALTAVQVQRALVPAGGGEFLVSAEKFNMVIEYFKSQGATVVGSESPFAPPPPGGLIAGARSATITLAGQSVTVMESLAAEPSSVTGAKTMLEAPFTQSARYTRMRTIARIILESQVATARTDPRAKQAEDVSTALKEIRDPFKIKPGEPPPPLEAYVPDFAVRENIRSVLEIRAKLLRDNPDVIIGMERYGSLFADILAYGHPELQAKIDRFEPVNRTETSTGKKGKFDQPSILAEFRRILGPDPTTSKTIAVVDSYMGGSTTESLLEQVYKVLAEEYPNARFRNYVIRETSGFKVSQDGKTVLPGIRGEPTPGSKYTGRVRTEVAEVSIVVGNDVALVYNLDSSEPVRVFDSSGKVVETFVPKPGQTTRQVLIEIMNGQYAAAPVRPVPDPVGQMHGRLPPDRDEPKVPKQPPTVVPVPVQ